MPWKRCPHCGGLSYSAASHRKEWFCPYCGEDLIDEPCCRPDRDAMQARSGELNQACRKAPELEEP